MMRGCAFPGEPHLLHEERLCIAKRGCAVPEKSVQYDEMVRIARRATFAI